MNNNPKISEWFFDNFEVIIDELVILNDLRNVVIGENPPEFEEEITHQSQDEFIRSISISCSGQLSLSYEECYDQLEPKLEELYYAFE